MLFPGAARNRLLLRIVRRLAQAASRC